MISISATIRRLVEELAGLMEGLGFGAPARPAFAVVQKADRFRCYRTNRRRPILLVEGELADVALARLPLDMRSRPVELRMDGDSLLSTTMQMPAASRRYLDAIMRHQVERNTPWEADRVVFDYVVIEQAGAAPDQIAVRLVAAARDTCEAVTERIAGAGLKASVIGTSDDPLDRASPINLLQASRTGRRRALRRAVAAALVVIALAGMGASAASGWLLWTRRTEADALEREIQAARSAVEARFSISAGSESHARLLALKQQSLPMVLLVEALSEIIPTSTYLTGLSVEAQDVRVAGFAEDAPALIGLLEDSAVLSEVRFAAPTIREAASVQDRFEIVARVDPVASP